MQNAFKKAMKRNESLEMVPVAVYIDGKRVLSMCLDNKAKWLNALRSSTRQRIP